MAAIDHKNTMVLLIGMSEFPEDPTITPIPNVLANIIGFKKSLVDPEVIGVPEENIIISLNESKVQVQRKLRDISENTRNKKYTLLVYYTGHGILSSKDYDLYLTTRETSKQYLESDGINIKDFKKFIKWSLAGRKVVILDCCHSGVIIGAMNNMPSTIQAELNGFEGTYVMTSAAEDAPSLFPVDSPDQPTYFTGRLLEVINDGIDEASEYCSLREVYNKIDVDFKQAGLPRPQQSNYNNADQLYISRNRKFIVQRPVDELAWKKDTAKQFQEDIKNIKGLGNDGESNFNLLQSIRRATGKVKIYFINKRTIIYLFSLLLVGLIIYFFVTQFTSRETFTYLTPDEKTIEKDLRSEYGNLPLPVDTGHICIPFGQYEVKGITEKGDNPGVTICTPSQSSAVKAVFDGEVSAVSNIGDGMMVMIRHGEYFTVYSNLSSASVGKGQHVRTGMIIGRVGINEEGISGGKLDFLIMAGSSSKSLDPEPWFRAKK